MEGEEERISEQKIEITQMKRYRENRVSKKRQEKKKNGASETQRTVTKI